MQSAERRAYEYLRRAVTQYRRNGCARLPPHQQLAAAAGVSPVVLLRALGRLKREGAVTSAPGRGIHVSGVAAAAPVVAGPRTPRRARWRLTAEGIRRDIRNGLYKPGTTIPAPKELSRRYGVCFRTLRKALHCLAERHEVEPVNRRFRVPAPVAASPDSTVTLVAAGYPDGSLHQFSSRTRDYLMALESECARSHVTLAVRPFALPPLPGNRVVMHSQLCASRPYPLGFVVFQHGLKSAELDDLLGQLPTDTVPVAVLDEGIGYRLPVARRRSGMARVFSLAFSPSAGEQIGRYLWGLNHHSAAFISVHGNTDWSRNRLQGLRNAFDELSGETGRVAVFESEEAPPTARQLLSGRRGTRSREMSLLLRLRRIDVLRNQIELLMRRELMRPLLVPLFHEALSRRDITAWVAANDDIALEGLSFLEAQGVGVPAVLSVVGFDDSVEAMMKRLTSYNFNCTAAAHALLAHIFDPHGAEAGGDSYEPVEIEGFISQKGSTGRAHTVSTRA